MADRDRCPRCQWHKPKAAKVCEECTAFLRSPGGRHERKQWGIFPDDSGPPKARHLRHRRDEALARKKEP